MNREDAERLLESGAEGVSEWNERKSRGEAIPNLREVFLFGNDLSGVDFSGVRLLGACLSCATLDDANLSRAALYGAELAGATAIGARFVDADLRRTTFGLYEPGLTMCAPQADVSRADFSRARLQRADLSATRVVGASFRGANLTGADVRYTNLAEADTTDATVDDVLWADVVRADALSLPRPVHFGEWLREKRVSIGMSPDELARKLGLGLIGYDVTNFMEKRSAGTSKALAEKLAVVFEIDVSEVPTQ